MKTVLVGINSSFTHTMLSVRCLESYAKKCGYDCKIAEFTVNNQPETVVSSLYTENADIYAFSLYIFNITFARRVASDLRKAKPNCVIIIGGPEVSNDDAVLEKEPYADIVMRGEGEEAFCDVLRLWDGNKSVEENKKILFDGKIQNLYYIYEGKNVFFGIRCPKKELDGYPFPYSSLDGLENRILYYESSRGCPFHCSYCLSAAESGVRFRSVERTCEDLRIFLDKKVRIVKFVDRTFNADSRRAVEIWKFLAENDNGVTEFHFEIAAWLLNDEELSFLSTIRKGLFRFEIGIQMTNPETAKAISRPISFEKLKKSIERIPKTVHIHTDLIAGLPYEDIGSFKKSFNDVYSLGSDNVQLGFLKILRGSPMWNEQDGIFSDFPPYEVISTPYMSYGDIIKLKKIEAVLEIYYNSEVCTFLKPENLTILYRGSFFDFYNELAEFSEKRGFFDSPRTFAATLENIYLFLCRYIDEEAANDIVAYDFYRHSRPGSFPKWLKELPDRNIIEKAVSEEALINKITEAMNGSIDVERIKTLFKTAYGVNFHFGFSNGKIIKCDRKLLFIYSDKTGIIELI
ncbi:MAG TPA: hypothetical protein DDY98_04040 [Ruminococcaceae bacterium]|nr:hypothetical protein [Oscillospiraceae bacterium]